MHNYAKYIGIPWESGGRDVTGRSLDCWGLVWAIYNEEYGIYLPPLAHLDIDDETSDTVSDIESIFPKIAESFDVVGTPKEGDIIVMSMADDPIHVGIALSDKEMIHSDRKAGCVKENFKLRSWERRIRSFHRHKDFAQK